MSNGDGLPKGWCWARIGDVGEVRLGRQRSPKNRSNKFPTKYVRAANITWNGIDLSDVLDMEFTPAEQDVYRLAAGDVILAEASGSPHEVGKPAIWRDELDNCCFQNTVIRFRSAITAPRYAHIIFSHFARNGVFARTSKGVNINHLSAARFGTIPFPLAPRGEQERIANKVEELFSDLDAGVAALERAKANLKRYRAAVLKAAAEGRLTEQWRAENPPREPASKLLQRILTQRRKKWEEDQLAKYAAKGKKPPANWKSKYKEPVGPDKSTLPELPKGWCWGTIDQVCPIFVDCAHRTPKYSADGIPALRPRDVVNGELKLAEAARVSQEEFEIQTQRRIPEAGDIAYSRELSFGWAAQVPESLRLCLSQGMALFRTGKGMSGKYLVICLNGPIGRAQAERAATGSAHPHINLGDIKAYTVPIAPAREQERIVSDVEQRVSIVVQAEVQFDANLQRATRLRQSILKRAFEGKLVPQDPTDEPAATVLERIKAERDRSAIARRAKQPNNRGRGSRCPS